MNEETVTCTRCSTEIHWLEVFPGKICLTCHAEKTAHLTPQQLLDQVTKGFTTKVLDKPLSNVVR